MPVSFTSLHDFTTCQADMLIDVRAPSEYRQDHIPGAVNLPVLSDAQRITVGTIYKQQSPFSARKIGAAMVARNAAAHIEGPLADKPGGWRPLVYCWRGGQRSGSFAAILREIGWQVETVKGGYKSWRRLVVQALHDHPLPFRLQLIDGGTGTGKTRLLARLAARGAQTIDLEALAAHRGSVFGPTGLTQPSQKAFEGRLAMALCRFDPARPVFVEAESARIGQCQIPPALWKAMLQAPRVHLTAPLLSRSRHLMQDYADIIADTPRLQAVLEKLKIYHGQKQVAEWSAMAAAGAYEDLCIALITRHYDPRYKQGLRRADTPVQHLHLAGLDDTALDDAAAHILQRAETAS